MEVFCLAVRLPAAAAAACQFRVALAAAAEDAPAVLRRQAEGVHTAAGTWAFSEAEARQIEKSVDADEKWVSSLEGKDQWINRPTQPPGLMRTGELSTHPTTPRP